MKSDTQLMNELAQRTKYLRELTEEESKALKKTLLEIYVDVARLCKEHNLTMMFCGGSCIGAIRHKGFIPWDDDIDTLVPRKDYEQLITLLEQGALKDKYEFEVPNRYTDSRNGFMKIYKKNTLNADVFSAGTSFPQGICLDVFPLDSVPKSKLAQEIKGFFAKVLLFISILVLYAQYKSPYLKGFMSLDKSLLRRYKLKCFLGKIFGIIPHRKWIWWYDRWIASSEETGYLGLAEGVNYYTSEILPKEVYLPASKAEFEGIEVYVPHDPDAYLRNGYGDYMQLPPVEKRERHFIVDFKLQLN